MLSVKLLVLVVLVGLTQAREFSRCDLAWTLLNDFQFPSDQLANWVCLAESESSRNTAAVGPPNTDGSQDYGLFQINSRYWCSGGPANQANECNIPCQSFIDDNLGDDVNCVRKIFGIHSWQAWFGWKRQCEGRDVSSYIANCGL